MIATGLRNALQGHARAISLMAIGLVAALAVAALYHLLRRLSLGELEATLAAMPPPRIAAAGGLCLVSYLLLTFYDVLALRQIGRPLPYRTAALASFVSYALSHNLGVSILTGGSARYRIYTAAGLAPGDVARIFSLASLTFWSGVAVAACAAMALQSAPFAVGGLSLPAADLRTAGVVLLALAAAGFAMLGKGRRLSLRNWSLPLPGRRQAALLLLISIADLAAASAALFVLLPSASLAGLPAFFLLYAAAMILALVTHVPGGLGAFEAVIIAGMPATPLGEVAAALLVYRLLYYWTPLALAAAALAFHEAKHGVPAFARLSRIGGRTFFALAPPVFAGLAIAGALVLLVSGALPAIPARLHMLRMVVPLPFVEASQIGASLAGTALLLLAPGLYRRLDGAFLLARTMLVCGAVFSLLKGFDFEEALVLGAIALALQANRAAFYRRTRLTLDLLSLGWIASFVLTLAFSVWIGFVAYRHVDYANQLWWRFAWSGNASRFLRGSLAAAVFLIAVIVRRLLSGAAPRPLGAEVTPPTLAELAQSARTEAFLALTGDKRFLREGEGLLMYQVRGHSWIVMGDPIGPTDAWSKLIWTLREKAHAAQGRVLLYQITPAMVPLAVELGLSLIKYGEEARVDLATFSLEGPGQRPLRYAARRAAREGAGFEIIPRADVPEHLDSLRAVSEQWLSRKGQSEKAFSVARFDAAYLTQFDCAVVKVDGRIVGFANLLQTANGEELSVDLMRYLDAVPYGTMDFLFVHLMLWGREQGFRTFNLGMAPLAGMPRHRLAPLWARAANMIFRHAEPLYGFEGLRAYKQKFDPVWEPRFIAGPTGLGMLRALVDLQALIGGKGGGRRVGPAAARHRRLAA